MNDTMMNGRIPALDNLRACMMWLGIVLHVCVNHLSGQSLLPFRDRELTPVADLLLLFIHSFRMPVFFVLAGFLAAMMVDTRGYRAMLRNRVRRIALPFAIFWPVLFVLTVVLVLAFSHTMATGTLGLSLAHAPKVQPGHPMLNTMHMWFVYYLFLFCLLAGAACAADKYFPDAIKTAVHKAMSTMAQHWWGCALLAIPMALVGSGYRAGMLSPSGSFIPNINEIIHSGMFFLYGWTVYRLREQLLNLHARQCWNYAAAGLVAFIGACVLFQTFLVSPASVPHIQMVIAYVYGSASWLWSIALIGLFIRYVPAQNSTLRYISDSSYWVFLVHMLGTIGFGVLLYNAPLGALSKMAINILATTAACLLTYHLFVRNTWIGVLLNGKRRSPPPLAVGVNA
jgi:glucan biosynthesis protein C